ncbi:efflux RND transporter periplasmic adaptor subunit [Phaeocystidibacter luteus]|uniref:Efflux RND transporter periplasmic adaptor subunit n=1 Tax=Phaeocystidibacter luteus TaxID=911197 RepID=A0A6N6RCK3_9FLAO|nr:efflux RND transporter periplasmic adaptor subunit [Phaeocystidibacter luteus]KAB2805346.1 efflux RND transporter periplasmic adaptor subunit [Phaeocystidibacter luteus]
MKSSYIIPVLLALAACSSPNAEQEEAHEHNHSEMAMGMPTLDTLYTEITCTGVVDVPPQSRATVSAPLGGYLRDVRFYPGERVSKGEVLGMVAHPDYIEIQHNYLDAQAKVKFLELDMQRKADLAAQNAVNERTLQQVESELQSEKSRMMAASAKLRQIGIDPSSLTADNIVDGMVLRSPIAGHITAINVNLGQHVTPEEPLYEIVDDSHMHIELSIFPRDIAAIRVGQTIEFYIPGDSKKYKGDVQQVGRQVNDESGAFIIHAHADDNPDVLRPGQYVEGKILLEPVPAFILPEVAVVTKEGKSYVFTKEGDDYHMIEVHPGVASGKMVQIMDTLEVPVVLEDAYLLLEAEGGHDHSH